MYFWLKIDEELLKKLDDIRNKGSNSARKEFDSELIYDKKYLKTKVNSYGDEAKDFHYKEIPKVNSNFTCLAVILVDFILKKM